MSKEILLIELTENVISKYDNRDVLLKGERFLVFNVQNSFYQMINSNCTLLSVDKCEVLGKWIRTEVQ